MNSRSIRDITYRVWRSSCACYDEYLAHVGVRREVLATVRARIGMDATREDVRRIAEDVIDDICREIEDQYIVVSSMADLERYVEDALRHGAFCGECFEAVVEAVADEIASGEHPGWGRNWSPYLRYVDVVGIAERVESGICDCGEEEI